MVTSARLRSRVWFLLLWLVCAFVVAKQPHAPISLIGHCMAWSAAMFGLWTLGWVAHSLGVQEDEATILRLLRECSMLTGLDLVRRSRGQLRRGAIYTRLTRMEERGLIKSYLGNDLLPPLDGRRFYALPSETPTYRESAPIPAPAPMPDLVTPVGTLVGYSKPRPSPRSPPPKPINE